MRNFDLKLIKFIFYINVVLSFTYILMFWGLYSEGSDRLYFNRDYRVLSLLTSISSLSTTSIYKKRIYFIFFVINLILVSAMGSRATAIVGIFIFAFFYFHCNNVNKLKYFFDFANTINVW